MADQATDLVFWDVDTQVDFMTPADRGGTLYVRDLQSDTDPGAVQIIPALQRLSNYAREHGILRVATGDWHTLDHREIDPVQPNFRDTYPPHCMADEVGSEKIPETRLRNPIVIPLRAPAEVAREAVRRALSEDRDIFLQKEEFSCFAGNPEASEALMEELRARAFVVYGVALDVCVLAAVEGMLDRGKTLYLVEDATWGLGLEPAQALFTRWEAHGLRRLTTEEVVSAYPPVLQ